MNQSSNTLPPLYKHLFWLLSVMSLLFAVMAIAGIFFFAHWHVQSVLQHFPNTTSSTSLLLNTDVAHTDTLSSVPIPLEKSHHLSLVSSSSNISPSSTTTQSPTFTDIKTAIQKDSQLFIVLSVIFVLLISVLLFWVAILYLRYLMHRSLPPLNEDCQHELHQVLEQLENAQNDLLKVEKMASLGKLLAGVAHEINTPLGAIRSSAHTLNGFWRNTLEQLPGFFHGLSDIQQKQLVSLLNAALTSSPTLSSKEERQHKRALRRSLDTCSHMDVDVIADMLNDMGIYTLNDEIKALLLDASGEHILRMAHKLIEALRSTQTIHTAIERAASMVLALKSFSHYDQKRNKTLAYVQEGIEIVLVLNHNTLKQGIELVRDYSDLPALLCYPDELIQVWMNLIHNAIQAMGEQGQLTISTRVHEQQIKVSIKDTGIGIPSSLQEKIFEPFFTTKPSGVGSGMGLEIVQKIVEKHDGKIHLQSVEQQGSCFTVILPLS